MLSLREARAVVGFGISGIFLSLDIACELVPKEMWLVDWLMGWLVDWLIILLVDGLIGWLVDWLIGRSIDRWIDPNHRFDAFSRSLQESAGKLSSSLNFFWPFGPQLSCPTSTSSLQGPICAIFQRYHTLLSFAIPSWQVVSSPSCVPTFSWRLSAGEPCLMTYYSLW